MTRYEIGKKVNQLDRAILEKNEDLALSLISELLTENTLGGRYTAERGQALGQLKEEIVESNFYTTFDLRNAQQNTRKAYKTFTALSK